MQRMQLGCLLVALTSACAEEPVAWPKADNPAPSSLGLSCEAGEVPPLRRVGFADALSMGPCGHVLYFNWEDGPHGLIALDGSQEDWSGYGPVFSPTGDRLAWIELAESGNSVVVRDLLSGGDQHASVVGFDYPEIGFVPTHPQPGVPRARLWSCTDGLLRSHAAGDVSLLGEQVRCDVLAPSESSRRIAFVTTAPELGLADLEQGLLALANPTPMDEPGEVLVPWLDSDGRRLLVRGGLDLGESPSEYDYDLHWAALLDDQLALVAELDVALGPARQGLEPSSPIWLMDPSGGPIYRITEERGVELIDDTGGWPVGGHRNFAKGSGDLFYARGGDQPAIMRIRRLPDAEPERLLDAEPDVELIASAGGRALAMVSPIGELDGDHRIRVWRDDADVLELAQELPFYPIVLIVREDGGLLIHGDLPGGDFGDPHYWWIDAEGRLLARWRGHRLDGSSLIKRLPDGRVVVQSNRDSGSPLALVYPNTEGIRWLFDGRSVSEYDVSADGRRIAAIVQVGDESELWYGAFPD